MIISVIIPTLNESTNIVTTLKQLQVLRKNGHKVLLADAGSTDDTVKLASPFVDEIIISKKGRAIQMNSAAFKTQSDVLWFLHADTLIPENADTVILNHLKNSRKAWGYFSIRLSGEHFLFRIIERMMNLRSKLSGIATGDQGIFIRQKYFKKLNGFAEIPLMEDIEISTRLKKISPPICLTQKLTTSSRRWEQQGIIKTILLMWRLRLAFFFGASTRKLAKRYEIS